MFANAVRRLIWLADRFSALLAGLAMAMLVVLTLAMVYEVLSRRLFNSPTVWAFDVSYMSNGAIFVLALGAALGLRRHITVDFLAVGFPVRVRGLIDLLFYGVVLTPILFLLTQLAWQEAYEAYVTLRRERVSPWAPVVWPYFSAMALGLSALLVQGLVVAVQGGIQAFTGIETQPNRAPVMVITDQGDSR